MPTGSRRASPEHPSRIRAARPPPRLAVRGRSQSPPAVAPPDRTPGGLRPVARGTSQRACASGAHGARNSYSLVKQPAPPADKAPPARLMVVPGPALIPVSVSQPFSLPPSRGEMERRKAQPFLDTARAMPVHAQRACAPEASGARLSALHRGVFPSSRGDIRLVWRTFDPNIQTSRVAHRSRVLTLLRQKLGARSI
jgi:hypothetical protein